MAYERNGFSAKNEIRNSVWECNHQPTLITLHDHYILFEDLMGETVIFYKHIVTIKKSIETINWDGPNGGGCIDYYKLILKTAAEDFTLSAKLSPSVIDNDLYPQIINKITGNLGSEPETPEPPQPPTENSDDKPEPPQPPTGNLGGEPETPGFGIAFISGSRNGIGKVPVNLGRQRGGAPIISGKEVIDYSDKTTEELLALREKYIKNKMGAINNSEKEYAVIQLKYITEELRRRNVEMPVCASKAESNYNG